MDESKPRDPGLTSAFHRSAPSHSVLTRIEERTGQAPRISLPDAEEDSAGSPVIDPKSDEKSSVPQGRGSYQLMGEIARGGMGVVLKGHDTDLGRDVALKVLNKDLSERPEVVQRFVEEAQIGGQLQHPGIVPVYELGLMADERPYFTMKLVKGRTFAKLLSERASIEVERARMLEVFESVCQTMAYAHSRGVIHRDLKPANIMVGAFGEVQVVDWGLAKVLARGGKVDEKRAKEKRSVHTVLETVRSTGSGSSTGTDSVVGSVMGTPAYMSPEQAAGHVDRLDERSDVFSLGAILCEVLTGFPPYERDGENTLLEAAKANLDPALERLDGCGADPELIELAKECLLPAPAIRPADASVVAERVHTYITSLEDRAQVARVEAAEARVHAEEERRARKLVMALAAAVVALFAVGGGGWVWVESERAAREREDVARERDDAERQRELITRVNAALNEAATLQGQERWVEASAVLDRADALAATGRADAVLLASLDEARAILDRNVEDAAAREERARMAAAFVSELEGIVDTDPEGLSGFAIDRQVVTDCQEVFRARGIDVNGSSPDEVVETLAAIGVGGEVAPYIDVWLASQRRVARIDALQRSRNTGRTEDEDLTQCVTLVEILHLLDDDPLRADLREALVSNDREMLTYLADGDLTAQPPSTLVLLATALDVVEEGDRALDVLRAGSWRHPDDFQLLRVLVRETYAGSYGPGRRNVAHEARMLARAALSLQPDSSALWQIVINMTNLLVDRAELAGDVERAGAERRAFLELFTAGRLPDLFWRAHVARAYLSQGEEEAGLGVLRDLLEDALAFGEEASTTTPTDREWDLFRVWRSVESAAPYLQRAGELDRLEYCMTHLLDAASGKDGRSIWIMGRRSLYYEAWFTRALRAVRDGSTEDVAAALAGVLDEFPSELAEDADEETRLEPVRNSFAWRCVRWPREVLRAACSRTEGAKGADRAQQREAADPDAVARIERNLDALLDGALEMSEIATAATDLPNWWNTLAYARYRVGDEDGAREALAESMREGGIASDFYLSAMLESRAGDDAAAARSYARAQDLTADIVGGLIQVDEALWFRAEARAELGMSENTTESR